MVVRPGAEPFRHAGGSTGVLLCHGFTGSPASLRPWAEHLASEGHTVSLPLLPGHGTEWRELQLTRWSDWYQAVERELVALSQECDHVFVGGLSMGGTLTLRLAEEHPDLIRGIMVVNPSVHSRRNELKALPLLRHVVPAVPGIVNDIKRPGQDEIGYGRLPLHALHSVTELWSDVSERLPSVTCPMLAFGSDEDHVVEPSNCIEVVQRVRSHDVMFVPLHDSYHVATLDNDAPLIFDQSSAFIRRIVAHAPTAAKPDAAASDESDGARR
ncbi:MAG TPA: alpha/beta fold hydrolase [Actinomycetes bacterium]|nr:alpha/beta fold hydrolase [Actinomycetes bacterium]